MPTYQVFPATPAPDYPLSISADITRDEIGYGDGYRVIASPGVNDRTDRVTLNWRNITKAEFDVLDAFADAHRAGTPFRYVLPNSGVQQVFTLKSWAYSETEYQFWTARAELEQYHGG